MKYLAAAAIMKNEGPYIEDWIKYHIKIGVERFYLIDNGSTDGGDTLAKKFPQVALGYITHPTVQKAAYNQILADYAGDARWIMFIDIDEYMVPHVNGDMATELTEYEEFAALLVHWRLFGSNGHLKYHNSPVVERFTRRENTVNPHVKSVVNPQLTTMYHNPHRFIHTGEAVDENKRTVIGPNPLPINGSYKYFQLNHYSTKSREECQLRRKHPRADNGTIREWQEFFNAHDRNEEEDLSAYNVWIHK